MTIEHNFNNSMNFLICIYVYASKYNFNFTTWNLLHVINKH